MDELECPPMERRLQRRYAQMVEAHAKAATALAAGAGGSVLSGGSMAATQAAWRFLNNEKVTLGVLIEPLRAAGRRALAADGGAVGLVVHDWSKLAYGRHAGKGDTLALTHATDVGYELATALLVGGGDGGPLAPMQCHLTTATGVLSTEADVADLPHVDQVLMTMRASAGWGLSKPLVHVIDREADSVNHYRQWAAGGHRFVVRADDRCVTWEGDTAKLSEIAAMLKARKALVRGDEVKYHGQRAWQWTASTPVTLERPGQRRTEQGRRHIAGPPLQLTFVVAEVRDDAGRTLATWMLLTNVEPELADAATIARWYYWRWRIESFFKLLKGHGQQIEQWQQQTGMAIARRLLVAAMACTLVWQLQRDNSAQADQTRRLLVRLSGRQMKHGVTHTAPALLAGLMILLPMLQLLDEHGGDLTAIFTAAHHALTPHLRGRPSDV